MDLTPQNRQAAHILTHIRGFESRPQGNQRPFPISVQPYSSSGQPKQWVQTPFTSSFGMQQGPGWYSPAPQIMLPGQRWRKSTRKGKLTRRLQRRSRNTRRRR